MRIGQSRHRLRRLAMTPLIDIVFILLLFFILETSFADLRELLIQRPVVANAQSSGETELLRLDLLADGRIWVKGRSLELDMLDEYLARRSPPRDTPVLLALAGSVTAQTVVTVCDLLHARGLRRIEMRALESLP